MVKLSGATYCTAFAPGPRDAGIHGRHAKASDCSARC